MLEFSGENNGIKWSVEIKRTPNAQYHALVKVGTWTVISEDHLTAEQAKDDGCSMKASMLEEIEEMLNA
jgi:hypothetical protein